MMNVPLPGNRLKKLMTNKLTGKAGFAKNLIPKPPTSSVGDSGLKQLSLAEFLQPMMAAMTQKQPWIEDFGGDQITMPADLYEVLTAFSSMQKSMPNMPKGHPPTSQNSE